MKTSHSNKVSENLSTPESGSELGRKLEDKAASKELKNASVDVAGAVSLDGMDVAGEVMGNISEAMTDSKDNNPASSGAVAGGTPVDPAVIKSRLLQNLPPEKVMLVKIEKEIKNEIKYLHKKAMKMMTTPGEANYFEMSNMLKKIRELNTILAGLLKASIENIKTLWLRFVHGVM